MSEIKLYFPGIGGNRYEVSMDELKDLAYKGKIKREDKLIVRETKDGNTTEVETVCCKIKGVDERFTSGERDRQAAIERKAAKIETKRLENERKRREEYERRVWLEKEQLRLQTEELKLKAGELAMDKVIGVIRAIALPILLSGILLGGAIVVLSFFVAERSGSGTQLEVGVTIGVAVGVLFYLAYKGMISLMMLPVWLTQYHAETIKKAILEAAGKSVPPSSSSSTVPTSNPDKRDSNS